MQNSDEEPHTGARKCIYTVQKSLFKDLQALVAVSMRGRRLAVFSCQPLGSSSPSKFFRSLSTGFEAPAFIFSVHLHSYAFVCTLKQHSTLKPLAQRMEM